MHTKLHIPLFGRLKNEDLSTAPKKRSGLMTVAELPDASSNKFPSVAIWAAQ